MREFFQDAQGAIRWACGLEGHAGRPLAARMLDKYQSDSDWTDTAIQAGVIWRTLKPLSGAPLAALVARSVPKSVRCSCRRACCSGHRANPVWTEAIDILCAAALAARLSCRRYDERRLLIMRVYGKRRTTRDIAEELSMEEHALGRHARELELWLGTRGNKGLEPQAWAEATRLLTEARVLDPPAERSA